MRDSFGLTCLLALVVFPLRVNAQDAEVSPTTEPSAEEPAPSVEPTPDERALRLQLEAAGVEVVPIPPTLLEPRKETDSQERKDMEVRVKRAWIGFGVSAAGLVAGLMTIVGANFKCGFSESGEWTESCSRMENAGIVVTSVGGAGMIVTGALVGASRRKLRSLDEASYHRSRRASWDLARSRLVF
jgi:hypothetical protein